MNTEDQRTQQTVQIIKQIYEEAVAKLDGTDRCLHWGPSHIVWEDNNFEDSSIEFCLKQCDLGDDDFTHDDIENVRESLLKLKEIPEEERMEDDDWDTEYWVSQNQTLFNQ